MVQGIDLELLSEKTGKIVYSSAQHGGGVYDFLVFTERVPNNSTCIIGFLHGCLLRKKNTDINNSGLSVTGLYKLHKHNYTLRDIYDIAANNRFAAKDMFYSESRPILYEYSDTIVYSQPMSMFEDLYSKVPSYFYDKTAAYEEALKTLTDKNCRIIFICFPYHYSLYDIEVKSPVEPPIDSFCSEVLSKYTDGVMDSITVPNDKTLMHDLTHMNAVGAERVTAALADQVDWNAKNNQFFLVNGRVCH